MSYEPDTNDIRVRQLKEEIAKIREEQFAKSFPTNQGGGANVVGGGLGTSAPITGVASWLPNVIRVTKDTGVIDLLNFDGKNLNKDFTIGETVTGQSSGATAVVGDIDTLTDTTGTLTLVPSSITGTFSDGEKLSGSGAGGNNIADVDGTLFTQTGRGHLNAGSASIIVDADSISSPFEIHFIDNAQNNGQIVLLRAQNGQTIRVKRSVTNDGNTGNLDLDESFNLTENALVFLQFQSASNVTPDGGWVPLITDITTGAVSTIGGGISFPILYPKENLGTLNGVIDLALNQSDGHYKQITLDGDASLTFSSLPPSTNGFKFYLLTIQDGTGGHVYTDLPNSVINEGVLLGQLQTASGAQTLWQFSTADGGLSWHSQVIQAQGAGGDNLGDHKATEDLKMQTFDIVNLDVLKYADGTQPGADGIIGFGQWGSAVDNDSILKWSIPASTLGNPRGYEWQVDLAPVMKLNIDTSGNSNLDMLFKGRINNTVGIEFFHLVGTNSSITPGALELRYDNGIISGGGGFHGFRVGNPTFPQFEIREDVLRANVNIDMITNNIFDIDQIRFSNIQGFVPSIDHAERAIGGGNTGIEMNIPQGTFDTTFDIFFENVAETTSDKEYSFATGGFTMFQKSIKDTLGLFFTNGGNFLDLATNLVITGGVNPGPNNPQTIKFVVKDASLVDKDMFELTGTEIFSGGGMKMFTDLNLQTQNINNVDVLKFAVDGGEIFGTEYAMGANATDTAFNFNVPLDRDYTFNNNANPIAVLDPTGLQLFANPSSLNPQMGAREFSLTGVHTLGTTGMLDGSFRLVGSDVFVHTGGNPINLSDAQTSFIGFTADDDLLMNTFNITGLDVLRFQVDGGVIGFGEYGISADAGNFSMNFSVPEGKGYLFQDNLDPIAFLDQNALQLLGNTGNSDPSFIGKNYVILPHSTGTAGQGNGVIRKVGDDVIIGSGDILVNLTTLSAGGADNLGNHLTLQSLDMNSVLQNAIINFTSMSSFLGHSMVFTPQGIVWNLELLNSDSYSWLGGGSTDMMTLSNSNLNVHNKRITNVANPTGNLDAVNLQTLNTGFVTTNTNQTTGLSGNKVWTGSHVFDSALTTINGSLTLGDEVTDLFNVTGRFVSALIPLVNGTALGNAGSNQRWDIEASNLRLQNGQEVNNISIDQLENNNFSLMTAQAIQDAITAGAGGGSFVTTNTTQINLSGSKTWTGSHIFDSALTQILGSINLGGSVSSLFTVNGRFLSDLIPFFDGQTLGDSPSQRWDIEARNLKLQSGSTVNNISNSSTQSSSSALMTANAIQSAISSGGGSFVTTNTSQTGLSGNKTWTGNHIYTGSTHTINSSAILIGNSSSDQVQFTARVSGSFIPVGNGQQLGLSSNRWEIDAQGLELQFGQRVTNISTSSSQSSSTALMTASAIQSAISAGGGGPTLSGNNNWTGFNSWTVSQTFQSTLNVQGVLNVFSTLNHDGSLMGFRGKTPISAPDYTVGSGPTDRTLTVSPAPPNFELAEVLGTVIRDLIAVGIFK